MNRNDRNIIWLRDTIDNLRTCEDQLEWTEDDEMRNVLLETMLRDLEACHRLCERLQRRVAREVAV